ncbi:TadE/TadG family type IV pilus assembly protein [Solicola sp. PLA-1-18]|uniref:TadE/TadG family type IV pilus assembly protein n=1 Tax=Solicola sp. PLA-1-18 TaxID=3380532 RepID=UPI003B7DB8A3
MRAARREGGTATLELVILAPAIFLVMSLMFAFGRISQAESLVDQASRDAARAATAQNSRSAVPELTREITTSTLATAPTSCKDTAASEAVASPGAFQLPDLSQPTQVERVRVTVRCQLNLADLAFLPLGTIEVERAFVSPLDRYRGYTP